MCVSLLSYFYDKFTILIIRTHSPLFKANMQLIGYSMDALGIDS